jgi:hypothetical protein
MAKNYTIEFNDDKLTAMLVSRRKRKERKEINVFLNYELLKQVNKMKYLGIIMDNKFKFRAYNLRSRKMHQTHIKSIQISQNNVGTSTWSPQDDIQRSHSSSVAVRSSSLDKHNEIYMKQKKIHQSTKNC